MSVATRDKFSFDCGIVDTRCLLCGHFIPLDSADRQSNLSVPLFYQTIFWRCDRYVGCIIITPLYFGAVTGTLAVLS